MERQLVRATPNLAYRSAAKILEKIRQLRSGFGNYPGIEGAVAAPTDEQSKWLNLFDKELQNVETSFNQFVSAHVPEINRLLMNSAIPYVISR